MPKFKVDPTALLSGTLIKDAAEAEAFVLKYHKKFVEDNQFLEERKMFPFIFAIIPAHNEEDSIADTIDGVMASTYQPSEIIVVADNCSDATIEIARAKGTTVFQTSGNGDGKAGGLNIVLDYLLPILHEEDGIFVMDADTTISPVFIEEAVARFMEPSGKRIGGIGGIFLADKAPWNLIRQLQKNEYLRYQRRVYRRYDRTLVLTGTGSLFKVETLRAIKQGRINGRLPDLGKTQSVYDISSLTEDNELTICAKELGYRVSSPQLCTVKTAMMPTVRSLVKQRIRWQRGALENLIAHRINKNTLPYAIRQFLNYSGVAFLPFYFYTLCVAISKNSDINFLQPLWLAVALVYAFEETLSVRHGGWKAMLTSALIFPEFAYTVLLNLIYIRTLVQTFFATDEDWGRVRNLHLNSMSEQIQQEIALANPRASDLHGTHDLRHKKKVQTVALFILLLIISALFALFSYPFRSLQQSWNIIAVYVLVGSLATLVRLVPVRFSKQ